MKAYSEMRIWRKFVMLNELIEEHVLSVTITLDVKLDRLVNQSAAIAVPEIFAF